MTGPAALFALAAAAVALALQISSGLYDEHALALVSLATIAALIAAFWWRRQAPPEDPATARAILGAGSAVGLACHLFTNPTFYADPRAFQGGFRWLAPMMRPSRLRTCQCHPSREARPCHEPRSRVESTDWR